MPGSLSQNGVLDDRATIMAFGPVIRDAILLRLERARIADPALPVRVALEAFSPFIPHEPDDSSLPVAILRSAWSGVLAASGFRYHGGRQSVEIPVARGASLLLGHGQLNLRALGAPERAREMVERALRSRPAECLSLHAFRRPLRTSGPEGVW